MSHSNLTDSEAHISTSLGKLRKYLDDAEDQSRTLQEVREWIHFLKVCFMYTQSGKDKHAGETADEKQALEK